MSEHPADEDLLRAVEVAPEPTLERHLAACAACRERVSAARAAARTLGRAEPAGRAFCPPRPLLAERAEGLLAGAARARLDEHAAVCPTCRGELRDLAALFAPEAALEPVPLRVQAVLLLDAARRGLELLAGALLPAPAPALVAVRGGGEVPAGGAAALAPFGAGALALTWAPAGGATDLLARSQGGAPRAFRLELGPAGEPGVWESHTADEGGAVRISGLGPGRYQVRAYQPHEAGPALVLDLEVRAA